MTWRRVLALALVTVMGMSSVAEAQRAPSLTEVRAELMKRSFRLYIERAWSIVEPKTPFVGNWHIDAIADHLEAVTLGDISNLLINVPPGCMKSLEVSVLWPTWEWALDDILRYLCISYDQALSTRDNRRVRDLVMSEWYQAHYPHVKLRRDQNQKTRFDTTAGGWRIGTSVGGRGLGEHPDRKIIDDPHNTKQAESDAERQHAIDFYDGTLSSRGAARNARTVVIMQRLHQKDLAGHIIEKMKEPGDVVHLCLPMRYEPKRMVTTPLGWNDPRTKPGELLWPKLFDETKVRKLEMALGSYRASGQLQQRPTAAEGGILKRMFWRYYAPDNPPKKLEQVVISIDPNLKAKALSDYAVAQAWGRVLANRYLLKAVRDRFPYTELKRQIKDLHKWAAETYPNAAISVVVENTACGPELLADLRSEIAGMLAENPDIDKVQRAIAATPALEAGNIFLPGAANPDGLTCDEARTPAWVQDFITECADFPNAANDDQVDAFSQAQKRLTKGALQSGDSLSSGGAAPAKQF